MIPASLAFLLLGCQAAPSANATPGDAPKPESPAPMVQSTPPSAVGQGASEAGQNQRRNIPDRQFQLSDLETAKVKIGKHEFTMWIMDTYDKRMEGMMFLENKDFKDSEGMIFVFPSAEPQRFWMKNTLVPLDIAYVGARRTILNTYTMRPLDTTSDYSSAGNSQWVLEFRAGLFKKLGIKAGDKVEIPANVKAKN